MHLFQSRKTVLFTQSQNQTFSLKLVASALRKAKTVSVRANFLGLEKLFFLLSQNQTFSLKLVASVMSPIILIPMLMKIFFSLP